MSKSNKNEHWRAIASEVGAEINDPEPESADTESASESEPVTGDADEVVIEEVIEEVVEEVVEQTELRVFEAEIEPTLEKPAAESRETPLDNPTRDIPVSRAPSRSTASNWAELASELGIDVPAAPEPMVEERDLPHEATPKSQDTCQADPAETKPSGFSFFEPDSFPETDAADVEPDATDEQATSSQSVESAEADSDAESSEEDTGFASRGRRRRSRGGRRRRGPRRADEGEQSDSDPGEQDRSEKQDRPETKVVLDEAVEDTSVEDDSEEKEDDQSAGRPRRRRRRRRPARRDDESGASQQPEDRQPDDTQATETARDTDEDDESQQAGELDAPKKHRKIPTWDEAVGVMVTANLESRSKNTESKGNSRGSRRRGRGSSKRG